MNTAQIDIAMGILGAVSLILLVGGCQALVWFGGYWQGFNSGHSDGWDGAMKYRDKLEAGERARQQVLKFEPDAVVVKYSDLGANSGDACN